MLLYEMVSQVQPQEETKERLRKTKLITAPGPRDRRPRTLHRATAEAPWRTGGRSESDGIAEATAFIGVSLGRKGRAEQTAWEWLV